MHSGTRFQKVAVSEAETLVHERLRVDETAKRLKTCAVSPEIVSVWMGPKLKKWSKRYALDRSTKFGTDVP